MTTSTMHVAVVVPTFNRAALLRETLASVLAQIRPADETWVIDDGSTDDTRAVVAAEFPGVRYHYQTNAYLGAARNAGLLRATGDALLFLDSDDRLLPGALAALEHRLATSPDVALAFCRAQVIDAHGAVTQALWPEPDAEGTVWEPMLARNFIRSAGAALIRRAALDGAGPWATEHALRGVEDWDLWLRLAARFPFARVDEPLFQYRVHGGAMSANHGRMHRAMFALYRKEAARHAADRARRARVARAYDNAVGEALYVWLTEARAAPDVAGRLRVLAGALRLAPPATLLRGLRTALRNRPAGARPDDAER